MWRQKKSVKKGLPVVVVVVNTTRTHTHTHQTIVAIESMHFKKKKNWLLALLVYLIYTEDICIQTHTHKQTNRYIWTKRRCFPSFSSLSHILFIIQWTWYPRFPCVHIEAAAAAAAADAAADDNDDCDVNRERTETIFFILY